VIAAETLERQLAKLVEARPLLLGDHEAQVQAALAMNILNAAEAKLVRAAYAARRAVIAVDDFPPGGSPRPVPGPTRKKRTQRKAS
jgi:hypothetical protein